MLINKIVPDKFNKSRLDQVLVGLKFVKSRHKAQSLIMCGNVYLNNRKVTKAGTFVKSKNILSVKIENEIWVSRGGVKLDYAIKNFNISVSNKVCLDIGCSTGGFTQVLITRGAKRVYSIDVGYGQFDWELRNSDKVELFERTNAKFINNNLINQKINLIVCDVSFISLRKVIKPSSVLLTKEFEIVALIKPQFETSKNNISRGGIVKNPQIHDTVCKDMLKWFQDNFCITNYRIVESPIKGQKGNTEFLIYINNFC